MFEKFFALALSSRGALAVFERGSERMIGSSRYYDLDLEKGEVVIGYTFLARDFWGGSFNREMKTLMLDHAFRFVSAAVFHVDEHNLRSRRAMEKIGGVLSGTLEKIEPDGRSRRNVVYRIAKRPQGKPATSTGDRDYR